MILEQEKNFVSTEAWNSFQQKIKNCHVFGNVVYPVQNCSQNELYFNDCVCVYIYKQLIQQLLFYLTKRLFINSYYILITNNSNDAIEITIMYSKIKKNQGCITKLCKQFIGWWFIVINLNWAKGKEQEESSAEDKTERCQ